MPFVNKSQAAACYAEKASNPDSTWDCSEWASHTDFKKLPKGPKKKAGLIMAAKNATESQMRNITLQVMRKLASDILANQRRKAACEMIDGVLIDLSANSGPEYAAPLGQMRTKLAETQDPRLAASVAFPGLTSDQNEQFVQRLAKKAADRAKRAEAMVGALGGSMPKPRVVGSARHEGGTDSGLSFLKSHCA